MKEDLLWLFEHCYLLGGLVVIALAFTLGLWLNLKVSLCWKQALEVKTFYFTPCLAYQDKSKSGGVVVFWLWWGIALTPKTR